MNLNMWKSLNDKTKHNFCFTPDHNDQFCLFLQLKSESSWLDDQLA